MGRIILTIGEPGTGKSRGILNLDENTTLLIKPNRKELPFKGGAVKYSVDKGNVVNLPVCKSSFKTVKLLKYSVITVS